jgi:hypothetical protein
MKVLSRRAENGEADLSKLIDDALLLVEKAPLFSCSWLLVAGASIPLR